MPPYPTTPPKPPKQRLPVAKRPVKRGTLDNFFKPAIASRSSCTIEGSATEVTAPTSTVASSKCRRHSIGPHPCWVKAAAVHCGDPCTPLEGKLYCTKDIVDDNFVPRNRKPKPIPKPKAKPAPKPAPKGKHVQSFKMDARLERASIPQLLMPLTGSEDLQNLLKFAALCVLVPCYDNPAYGEVWAGFQ